MAQHDYNIANGTGAAVRSDLNNALSAIVTNNSGATEPTTTYAYMPWADTTTGLFKIRNAANNGWITLYQLDGEWSTLAVENGSAAAPSIYFKDSGTDTGIYSPGTDQVAISTGGTGRLVIDSSGNVNIDSNTLYVDASNNRVGLGTSSPGELLDVAGNIRQTGNTAGTGNTVGLIDFYNANNTTTIARINVRTDGAANSGSYRISTASAGTLNEVVRIDSSGRLGIGTTGPSQALEVNGSIRLNNDLLYADATATRGRIYGDSTGLVVRADTGLALRFHADAGERARIDTSGRLLVGTSSARSNFSNGTPTTQYETATSSFSQGLSIINNGGSSSYFPILTLGTTKGTSVGSNTSIGSAGDGLGRVDFAGADGTNLLSGASITAVADGTWGTNDAPTRLVFSTTADGASSPTERMRINNAGDVFIGGTGFSLSNNNKGLGIRFSAATSSGGEGGSEIYNSSTSAASAVNPALLIVKGVNEFGSGNRFIQFYANNTTPMGGIVGNGASNVQFASLSDERDKANIEPLVGAAQKIQQLSVVAFDWKNGGGHVDAGFIAQNVETIFPEYVIENVSDGNSEPRKGITGGMSAGYVAVLTAALQEALQKIEDLETRLSALESA